MIRLLTLVFICFYASFVAQVNMYFNFASYHNIKSGSYLETHTTIVGKSVRFAPKTNGYQASVNISLRILNGNELIKSSVYNVLSPIETDSVHKNSFIDSQRFFLENGTYTVELVAYDNALPQKKVSYTEQITILYNRNNSICFSDIQPLQSFTKTELVSILSKNGYDLIPYTVNYFPKNQTLLKFYTEAYNIDTAIQKNAKFIYSYYIQNSETQLTQGEVSGFQKQITNKVNPLLAQLNITELPSGNYNLVVEIRDSTNTVRAQKKWFFQRQSDVKNLSTENVTTQNISTIEAFFDNYKDADTLKQFVECLWPRSNNKEREWQQTQLKNKQPILMRSYLVDYWKAEAGDSASPLKLWITYYKSVLETNTLLKCGKQKGYFTDRGRVYLQYGKPSQRNQVNSEPNSYPYEIWQYYRVYDKVTGNFYSNKKFVFVNFGIADDCYKLIHSDMRSETNDARWKFKLLRRSQNSNNYDETEPTKTFGNNADENFNNPR